MNNNEDKNHDSGRNMGFVDDYANDSIKNRSVIRSKDGDTVYSNPLENENGPKRRVTKNSRKRYRGKNRAFAVLAIFLSAVVAASVIFIVKTHTGTSAPEDSALYGTAADFSSDSPDAPEAETSDADGAADSRDGFVTVPSEDIHKGNLILVNYMYKYVFPEEDPLVSMYDKNSIYSVNATETYLQKEALDSFCALVSDFYENSGCDDILVVSAYRSIEKQESIYQDRLERYGSEYAAAYVADPGYSEHHTGLAMDLQIYTNGVTYDIEDYEGCEWFNNSYDMYGYILRYPENKAQITSINYESWHYRYVGLPHSLIMDSLDLCLEEYLDYIKAYTFEKPLVYNKNTGEITAGENVGDLQGRNMYIIYYVPCGEDTTDIPLLSDRGYTVSGNNTDGFIVTYSPEES